MESTRAALFWFFAGLAGGTTLLVFGTWAAVNAIK